MKAGLVPGSFAELHVDVISSMCPHFDGVLVHPVFATWEMVHYMEVAGRKLIAAFLEPHEEAVGAAISVAHRSPATIGSRVAVRAEVESLSQRRVTARVSAHCGTRVLGEGTFVQVVLPRERLEAMLRRYTAAHPATPT